MPPDKSGLSEQSEDTYAPERSEDMRVPHFFNAFLLPLLYIEFSTFVLRFGYFGTWWRGLLGETSYPICYVVPTLWAGFGKCLNETLSLFSPPPP